MWGQKDLLVRKTKRATAAPKPSDSLLSNYNCYKNSRVKKKKVLVGVACKSWFCVYMQARVYPTLNIHPFCTVFFRVPFYSFFLLPFYSLLFKVGWIFFYYSLFVFIWVYPGLSCGTWVLQPSLQHMEFLVAFYELWIGACGTWFPDQGLNPGPLHWEGGVLITGPPGKSLNWILCFASISVFVVFREKHQGVWFPGCSEWCSAGEHVLPASGTTVYVGAWGGGIPHYLPFDSVIII